MKKISLLAFVLVLLSMSMLGSRLVITVSGSTTHHVYSGESIQEAINSAQPGDTIFVHNGTYYENVVVNKSLSLIGENKHNTIIDGNYTGNVMNITANNVNITGFTIQNGGDWLGICIHEWSIGNTISYNVIRNNQVGIQLNYSSGNTVSGNTLSNNNNFGIYVHGADSNILLDNIITSNADYGIIMDDDSSDNTLSNNTISTNYGPGLYLHYSDINTLYNNTIMNNSYAGIILEFSSSNVISRNYVASNGHYGIRVDSSDNNILADNNITHCSSCGIAIGGFNNTLSGNTVSYSLEVGISLGAYLWLSTFTSHNILTDNMATNNWCGFFLLSSNNNTLTGSTALNNTIGIYLDSSNYNLIYHNNFINNTDQVFLENSTNNVWDDSYPSGGNYWSDYTDVDQCSGPNQDQLGSDGIWDHPYVIDENNQDNYPIVPEFPTWTSILLILIVLTIAIAIYKRRLLKTPIQ